MENAYVQEYGSMWATSLTREMHERTCGYWYTITNAGTAHTAFRTRDELDTWLAERGLTLAATGWAWDGDGRHIDLPLADPGTSSHVQVIGRYRRVLDRDVDRFDRLEPLLTATVLDNGERVLAKVTETDGVRSVHVVNVNYRRRSA